MIQMPVANSSTISSAQGAKARHPCDHRDPGLAQQLVHLASHFRLEGLVLVPPVSLADAVIRALSAAEVPLALLAPARTPPGACAVPLDDEGAAQTLAAHVIELGHRRIGFVRGHPDHESSRARLASALKA